MRFHSILGLAFLSLLSSAAVAQFQVDTVVGDLGLTPGENLNSFDVTVRAAGEGVRFRGATSEPGWIESPYGSRGIVRMRAVGNLLMSSDNHGNLSLASDGEVRSFTTWNSAFTFPNGGQEYLFGLDYSDTETEPATAEVRFEDMSYENLTGESGPTFLSLDNSSYDLNPEVGKIKIDRSANEIISDTTATIGAGRAKRELYFDGESFVPAPFYDNFFMSPQLVLEQNGSFVAGLGGAFSGTLGGWMPGEDDTNWKSFSDQNLGISLDFRTVPNGVYQATAYAALWQNLGSDASPDLTGINWYPGTSSSRFDGSSSQYEIEIVPEPGTLAALAFGAGAMLRRRRK